MHLSGNWPSPALPFVTQHGNVPENCCDSGPLYVKRSQGTSCLLPDETTSAFCIRKWESVRWQTCNDGLRGIGSVVLIVAGVIWAINRNVNKGELQKRQTQMLRGGNRLNSPLHWIQSFRLNGVWVLGTYRGLCTIGIDEYNHFDQYLPQNGQLHAHIH